MGLINFSFLEEANRLAVEGKAGEELLYDYDGLLKILDACEKHAVVILGVEGFNKIDSFLEPNEYALADFSSLSNKSLEELVKDSVNES